MGLVAEDDPPSAGSGEANPSNVAPDVLQEKEKDLEDGGQETEQKPMVGEEKGLNDRITRKGRRLAQQNESPSDTPRLPEGEDIQPGAFNETRRPYGLTTIQWTLRMAGARQRSQVVREEGEHMERLRREHTRRAEEEAAIAAGEQCEIVEPNLPALGMPYSQSVVDGEIIDESEVEAVANIGEDGHLHEQAIERQKRRRLVFATNTIVILVIVVVAIVLAMTLGGGESSEEAPKKAPVAPTRPNVPTMTPIMRPSRSNWVSTGIGMLMGRGGEQLGTSISLQGNLLAFGLPGRLPGFARVVEWESGTQVGQTIQGNSTGDFRDIGRMVQLSPDGQFLGVGGAQAVRMHRFDGSKDMWVLYGSEINANILFAETNAPASWSIRSISFVITPDTVIVSVAMFVRRDMNISPPSETTRVVVVSLGHNTTHSIFYGPTTSVWEQRGNVIEFPTRGDLSIVRMGLNGNLLAVGMTGYLDPTGTTVDTTFIHQYKEESNSWFSDPVADRFDALLRLQDMKIVSQGGNHSTLAVSDGSHIHFHDFDETTKQLRPSLSFPDHVKGLGISMSPGDGTFAGIAFVTPDLPNLVLFSIFKYVGDRWEPLGEEVGFSGTDIEIGFETDLSKDAAEISISMPLFHSSPLSENAGAIVLLAKS